MPDTTEMRREVILNLTQSCRAMVKAKGMIPTTVRIEIAGITTSVHDGAPSKKVSS